VTTGDREGQLLWQRFLVSDPHAAEPIGFAQARLGKALPAQVMFMDLDLEPDLLVGPAASRLLRESFAASKQENPSRSTVSHWQAWARQMLERADLEAEVRKAIQTIAEPREA
jgi:hypothetical protein